MLRFVSGKLILAVVPFPLLDSTVTSPSNMANLKRIQGKLKPSDFDFQYDCPHAKGNFDVSAFFAIS